MACICVEGHVKIGLVEVYDVVCPLSFPSFWAGKVCRRAWHFSIILMVGICLEGMFHIPETVNLLGRAAAHLVVVHQESQTEYSWENVHSPIWGASSVILV